MRAMKTPIDARELDFAAGLDLQPLGEITGFSSSRDQR
jgi:hypothetical protein